MEAAELTKTGGLGGRRKGEVRMTYKCKALVVHKSDASDLSEPSNQEGAEPPRGLGSGIVGI